MLNITKVAENFRVIPSAVESISIIHGLFRQYVGIRYSWVKHNFMKMTDTEFCRIVKSNGLLRSAVTKAPL